MRYKKAETLSIKDLIESAMRVVGIKNVSELARLSGVTEGTIRKMLKGGGINSTTMGRLAAALKIPIAQIAVCYERKK
jgi:predicted transcriptional regulator